MPELPEVEIVKRGLREKLVGHTIARVRVLRDKSYSNDESLSRQFVVGAKVINVRRRAKILMIDLSTGYSLLIHLKMTGQLVYRGVNSEFGAGHPNDSLVEKLPDNTTRVIFELNSATLFFNDQRVFGWVRIVPTKEISGLDMINKLGPEPLASSFTPNVLKKRLERRKRSRIKPVLLDQTVIAGIGNIYADEALWLARLHPERTVESLSSSEIKILHKAIKKVLQLGIDKGGSTDKNYRDAEGRRGSYLEFAKVFRREGEPCERCGAIIEKIKVASRGTHYCRECQKR